MNNNITRIQLHGANAGFLDVEQSAVFPLNFGIAEIRDLSKRKGTFSKSITLTGSKNNHQLLNHYFDVNIESGTFDINRLQYCDVIQSGVIILESLLLQLVSINKEQHANGYDEKVSYTVVVKDSIGDLFSTINNRLLTDIDFSYLDHTFEASAVTASFTNTVADGYKYVMGFNPDTIDDASFNLNEFTPAIYAKQYFDRIFGGAGYSYSWPSLANDDIRFDKLVIPYNGDTPPQTVQDLTACTFNRNSSVTNTFTGTTTTIQNHTVHNSIAPVKLDIMTETYDPAGIYSAATSTLFPPYFEDLTNRVEYRVNIEYEVYVDNQQGVPVTVKGRDISVLGPPYFDNPDALEDGLKIKPYLTVFNGSTEADLLEPRVDITNGIILNHGEVFGTGITPIEVGSSSRIITATNLEEAAALTLRLGVEFDNLHDYNENIWYNLWYEPSGISTIAASARFKVKILAITVEAIPQITSEYGYLLDVNINDYIPKEVKQSDFLRSIFSMYNLYAELDKDSPRKINITPRDEYYDSGVEVDWTKKLCKDKTQELKFLPELSNKKYLLTYKEEESDGPNAIYKDATSKIYGQLEYTFDNEYVRDTTKVELIFGPSPMTNTSFGAVTPMVNGNAPQTEPRILIDGGEYPCGPYKIFNTANQFITTQTYPHISHWDKPIAPTFDINFGACDYYFRSDDFGAAPVNNLFNLHWRRTLNQINSGRLLTAYFNLNEADIQSLRLNHKIRIDNSWWNINSIKDYDANSNAPTKVELITADDGLAIAFIPAQTQSIDRTNKIFLAVNALAKKRDYYNNTILTNGHIDVYGVRNYIGPNVNNAIVIGNNTTVTQSNTLYVDNIIVKSGGTINGQSVDQIATGEVVKIYILGVKDDASQDYYLLDTGQHQHIIFDPVIPEDSEFFTLYWNFPQNPLDQQRVEFSMLHDIPFSFYILADGQTLLGWPEDLVLSEGMFFTYTYFAAKNRWYKTSS